MAPSKITAGRALQVVFALVLPVVLILIAVGHLACNSVLMVAPPGSSILLIANPSFVPAHGGVALITAFVNEGTSGVPVADGTVIQFFTNLGRIDERARTNDGVAHVNFVSDSRSGTATIRAISGGGSAPSTATATATATASGTATATTDTGGGSSSGGANSATVDVVIGNLNASQIILSANPQRISVSRSSLITATVLDSRGNPVANVPVFFSVLADGRAGNEQMDSGGNPVFTDNNGRAQDFLRTIADFDGQYVVQVSARTATVAAVTIPVTIN